MSKGIQVVLDWLKLTRQGTSLQDRKSIEMFGYILRTIIQRIVFKAIQLEDTRPISLASYTAAVKDYK